MNNKLNARISKLVYRPLPSETEIAAAGTVDRVLLLLRSLYDLIDDTPAVKKMRLKIKHEGKETFAILEADDRQASREALRQKRWQIYARTGYLIELCEGAVSVEAANLALAEGADAQAFLKQTDALIRRFGLSTAQAQAQEAALAAAKPAAAPSMAARLLRESGSQDVAQAEPAAGARQADGVSGTAQPAAEDAQKNLPDNGIPPVRPAGIISRKGSSLSRINSAPKAKLSGRGSYAVAPNIKPKTEPKPQAPRTSYVQRGARVLRPSATYFLKRYK